MRGLTVTAIVTVALALLVILGFFTAGAVLKNGNEVFPNVCVLGVNLGGMELQEAEEALNEAMTAQTTRTLTVQLPDRKLVFEPKVTHTAQESSALAEKALRFHEVSKQCEQERNKIINHNKVLNFAFYFVNYFNCFV